MTVTGAGEHKSRVLGILDRHNPIDIDERAASDGATSTSLPATWQEPVMQPIHPYPPNIFTRSPLDRMDARRKDAAWTESMLDHEACRFVPVWRSRILVLDRSDPVEASWLPADTARPYLLHMPWALLGVDGTTPYVAIDLSTLDVPLPAGAAGRFEDLRRVATVLPASDAAILAHARGLMHWRARHRFCSVCGAACIPQSAGHVLACTGCGAHHFPRTDPAVIMLVTYGDRALLGLPQRFRDIGMFSTLAGFVEPGESLEEAVAREVHEEAGVRVGHVRYRSSQPWPFPASIMLGFEAEAQGDVLTIDGAELADARWFTRAQLRAPDGFLLPPDMSIARRLIQGWIDTDG